jgi:hypothetical protein
MAKGWPASCTVGVACTVVVGELVHLCACVRVCLCIVYVVWERSECVQGSWCCNDPKQRLAAQQVVWEDWDQAALALIMLAGWILKWNL